MMRHGMLADCQTAIGEIRIGALAVGHGREWRGHAIVSGWLQQLTNRLQGQLRLPKSAAAMTVSLLATLYPARNATGIAPVEVLRYE